jgi:hypothetical protein
VVEGFTAFNDLCVRKDTFASSTVLNLILTPNALLRYLHTRMSKNPLSYGITYQVCFLYHTVCFLCHKVCFLCRKVCCLCLPGVFLVPQRTRRKCWLCLFKLCKHHVLYLSAMSQSLAPFTAMNLMYFITAKYASG